MLYSVVNRHKNEQLTKTSTIIIPNITDIIDKNVFNISITIVADD